jgi:hypothetical protein
MIARHRGEHHAREPWHPRRNGTKKPAAAAPPTDVPAVARRAAREALRELAGTAASDVAAARASRRWRAQAKILLLLLAGVAAFLAHDLLAGEHTTSRLPATPRQWVDAYEAAVVDNPQRVCTELFSPQLARAYGASAHSSCTSYFARVRSTSIQVRRILHDGGTAVVELHQTIERTDWNVVLDRHDAGWRAVDLVPGRPLQ